jgi:ribonuclease G
MAKNLLVISVDIKETRVALIEGGIIAELHIERSGKKDAGSVGDVVLGKVTRVLPGLQAAFIDIGQERAAFLHVEDLIRPDDFDAYLAGGRKHAKEDDAGRAPVEVTGNEEIDAEAEADLKDAPSPAASSLEADVSPTQAEVASSTREEKTVAGEEADVVDRGDATDPPAEEEPTAEDRVTLTSAGTSSAPIRSTDSPEPPTDQVAEPPPWSDPDLDASVGDGDGDDDRDDSGSADSPDSGGLPPVPPSEADALEDRAPSREVSPISAMAQSSPEPEIASPVEPGPAPRAARRHSTTADDFLDMPGFTISEPGDVAPRAPARPRSGGNDRQGGWREGGGRRRGRGRRNDQGRPGRGEGGGRGEGREGGGRSRGHDGRDGRNGGGGLARISKTTPIRDVVKEGQEIIVQVSKDPIGTKGARCTSHISLPGRYVVYLPTVDHVGVSKRIGSEAERARLREAIVAMKPPSGGLIVRTVAEGLTKKQLKADVGYLVRLWGEIAKKREGAKAPTLLSSELDLVLKTARDLFTDEVDQIVIDDKHQYDRLCRFVEMFMPERIKDILYYSGDEPIFDAYGIEDEIGRALSRKVPLPSGGYLIIDQAEALTAIDVNTGRFVGKGSKDMEETILKTNLEAVREIAYQLRFRNIGGLIILDLIDMERHSNREKVRRALEDLLQKDKAKTTLNRISDLGLIEMTRKRTRESLGRLLHEPCFYCDGTGQLQSKETIAYEILREIRRRRHDLPGYTVVVHAHPAVADLLQGSEKDAVADAENKFMRKIQVIPRTEYHLEQFDLSGK